MFKKTKKLYKKTKAFIQSSASGSSGSSARSQDEKEESEGRGESGGVGTGTEESGEEEEWVDCGGDEAAGDDDGGIDSANSKVDVRMEQLLAQVGVGPLVREQFLALGEEDRKSYTKAHNVRLWCTTFNVNGKPPPEEDDGGISKWLLAGGEVDIYAIGFQEIMPLTASNVLIADNNASLFGWECKIDQALNGTTKEEAEAFFQNGAGVQDIIASKSTRKYLPIMAKSLVGVYLTIWVKSELMTAVEQKEVVSVSCGVMRLLGNKGSVSIRLRVWDTYISFICVHLSSGESDQDRQRRYWDMGHIFQKSTLASHSDLESHYNILDSDFCFLFGDLNFRLNAEEDHIRHLIHQGSHMSLLESDQLAQGMQRKEILHGWNEGEITFPPTFKYIVGTNTYVGASGEESLAKASEEGEEDGDKKPQKKRSPAWCDRILWKATKPIKLFGYSDVADVKISDHKPVFGGFMVSMHQYLEEELDSAIHKARRLADLKEMEGRPQLELSNQFFDFGVVKFDKKVTQVAELANTGPVDAHWHLSVTGDKPDWLEVQPVQGKVSVGKTSEIVLTVHLDGGIGGSAGTMRGDSLETILVMSVAGSGDKFISITGTYKFSCFGVTPDRLCERKPYNSERVERLKSQYASSSTGTGSGPRPGEIAAAEEAMVKVKLQCEGEDDKLKCMLSLEGRGREGGGPKEEPGEDDRGGDPFEFVPIVPLELQNLVQYIAKSNGGRGLRMPNLVISPSYPSFETIEVTREAMDTDSAIPASVGPVDASLVLLMYLTSFPEPLLPKQVADVCSLCVPDSMASLDLLRNSMSKTSYGTFLYLMKFFRDVLKKGNAKGNGLTVEVLSATLASVFLTYEIASTGPLSQEGTLGYNDILKRRADFIRGFLVNVL
ncbi:inositol polyphosphate phosphatase [Chloropicon primus]|uniref:Inositol polyphosphate phosphatase n=2 Tax=Chloropicon primus TaxID=1764295 RepID=A0A5B8MJ16_9CHLO|nr:inositol polyphosphate phosphatase [Chloropicon primus]|eukprot:QDZ20453.1 inositol polyphosphate phosphatase [Chloropicon primus]